MFTVYILISGKKQRYYCGHTNDFDNREVEHNSGENLSTRWGIPWKVVHTEEFSTRAEAMRKEKWIKKRGISRYLKTLGKG